MWVVWMGLENLYTGCSIFSPRISTWVTLLLEDLQNRLDGGKAAKFYTYLIRRFLQI